MTYIEGPFGALVAVCSGLGAILSSAFGQYKAALSFLIVAVGSFILRAFLITFFPDMAEVLA
jgi:hydrogenase-4 membrane subunit HyfE